MSFACGFEGFVQMLGGAFRVDRNVIELLSKPPRWFQWGYVDRGDIRDGVRVPSSWYILVRLPSYLMAPSWNTDDYRWHQRCLYFKEPIPAGHGGWEMINIECWWMDAKNA